MTDNGESRQSIGERLLVLRGKSNLTQEELAERLLVSRQSVSKWELNKTLPDVEKLIQLSELYQVSMDYLIIGKQSVMEGGREMAERDAEDAGDEEEISDAAREDGAKVPDGARKGGEDATKASDGMREGRADATQMPAGTRGGGIDRIVRKTSLLVCMILSGILCVAVLVFEGRLLAMHTGKVQGKKQDLAYVERIYEQYTKAEVRFLGGEDGIFEKKIVWLDVPGVREDDYIDYFCDEDGKKSGQPFFEYYTQTLLLPVIAGIILLIFFITFWIEWRGLR